MSVQFQRTIYEAIVYILVVNILMLNMVHLFLLQMFFVSFFCSGFQNPSGLLIWNVSLLSCNNAVSSNANMQPRAPTAEPSMANKRLFQSDFRLFLGIRPRLLICACCSVQSFVVIIIFDPSACNWSWAIASSNMIFMESVEVIIAVGHSSSS